MGIEPRRVEFTSFLVAGLLAAFAGVAIYSFGVIQPSLGTSLTVKAFVITVLAGMGSVPGVLVGALLLGITESLTTTFASSALQELAGMVLFLLVLFVLPNGLFGRRADECSLPRLGRTACVALYASCPRFSAATTTS